MAKSKVEQEQSRNIPLYPVDQDMDSRAAERGHQIERFAEISAAILSIQSDTKLFDQIAQAVVDISDFKHVLISHFIEESPQREIIGSRGISAKQLEKANEVLMPREKYLELFKQGIKIGIQSSFIPQAQEDILDKNRDNLLVAIKNSEGNTIGILSVSDSKSRFNPTDETVRPIEICANLISGIIQRRKLGDRIQESEEKYRGLLNNIIVGIFRADREGNIIEANPTAVEMLGYSNVDELLSLNISDLCQKPEDTGKLMNDLEEKDFIKNWDLALKKKDGSIFWASQLQTAQILTRQNPSL